MKPRTVLPTMIWLLCWPYVTHGQTSNPDLIAQAKKEGRITWYTTVAIPESKQFIDMFEKQYPFIKVDLLRSGSGPLVNRIVSEYAAKNYAPDVLHGVTSRGGFTALRQRNIIGRYESPERKFYAADLKDKEGYWSSTFQNTFVLAYNKRNVKPDDVPRTYDDLLKPIWKGRQIINDTDNFEWFDGLLKHWGRDKGMAYFRRLAQQDQIFQRGARGRVQLVAAGEAPLTIAYGPPCAKFRQPRRADRMGAVGARGGDHQRLVHRAESTASGCSQVVHRFPALEDRAGETARDEPDSLAQRCRIRSAQAHQGV